MAVGDSIAVRNATIPVVPSAPSLEALGIGGILSPQALAPPGFTTLIDLSRGRLAVLTGSLTAADRTGPGQSLAPEGLRVCAGAERRYLVSATIEGQPTTFEIDTGSSETHIFANSRVGRSLAPEPRRQNGAARSAANSRSEQSRTSRSKPEKSIAQSTFSSFPENRHEPAPSTACSALTSSAPASSRSTPTAARRAAFLLRSNYQSCPIDIRCGQGFSATALRRQRPLAAQETALTGARTRSADAAPTTRPSRPSG